MNELERLRALVEPYGWEPRITEEDGQYRAWLRKPAADGWTRMFGRPAETAEAAVAALERKVRRWLP